MASTSQVWETYEKIVSETIDESTLVLEENDGQDYCKVLKELRREWELKLIQSGALALGAEVDPQAQNKPIGRTLQGDGTQSNQLALKKEEGEGDDETTQAEERGTAATAASAAAEKEEEITREDPEHSHSVKKKGEKTEREEGNEREERTGKRRKTEPSGPPTNGEAAKAKAEEDIDVDDDIDDLLEGGEDPTKDLVLAQVEKKFKSKNKYRFIFKSGIMQIDGLEYVFEKGNGDFKW